MLHFGIHVANYRQDLRPPFRMIIGKQRNAVAKNVALHFRFILTFILNLHCDNYAAMYATSTPASFNVQNRFI